MNDERPDPAPRPPEMREDASLIAELGALRDVAPPTALVARVMTRIAAPQPFSFWRWLRRPIRLELQVSLLSALLIGGGLTGGAALLVRGGVHRASSANDVDGAGTAASGSNGAAAGAPVLVRFVFEARGAHRVAVAGSFNDWKEEALRLESDDDAPGTSAGGGLFVATLPLPRGTHEYLFVVDGRWVADPLMAERRPDGFGRQNSLLRL